MKGLWLEDQSLCYRTDLPRPRAQAGEALIRVRCSGICNTDLELIKGYYPFKGILGHEFVGTIVESPGQPERQGERVVGEINAYCGNCSFCREGLSTHCSQRTVLGIVNRNGAFAEYLTLPLVNLFTLPAGIEDRAAVFVEPIAAALQILEQVQFQPSQEVVLIGAGKLGQLIARVVHLTAARLRVMARYPEQQRLLAEVGIECVRAVDEKSVDVVIEATGSSEGLAQALSLVKPRGKLVLKSTYQGGAEVDLARVVVDELTLTGSRCGPFEPAIRLLAAGVIDPTPLIDSCYPLSEGSRAVKAAARSAAGKVLLEISE